MIAALVWFMKPPRLPVAVCVHAWISFMSMRREGSGLVLVLVAEEVEAEEDGDLVAAGALGAVSDLVRSTVGAAMIIRVGLALHRCAEALRFRALAAWPLGPLGPSEPQTAAGPHAGRGGPSQGV